MTLLDRSVRYSALVLTVYLGLHALPVLALTSDRSKPATIEADQVEFDFRTGKRIYKGNVIVVQGTLKVTGDKMEVQYDNNNQEIQSATSWGKPATFKQRPDGKDADVHGEGDTIILNEKKNTLTLINNAVMTQAGDTAKGKRIVYHMDTDKMTVVGASPKKQTGATGITSSKTKTGRARVVILPDQQPGATKNGKSTTTKAPTGASKGAGKKSGGQNSE